MYTEDLKFEDFKFFNEPIPYSKQDYLEARRGFVSACFNLPGIKSIYLMKNKIVPGISDMDFVAVLNDGTSKFNKENLSIKRFNEKLQYLYYHAPLVMGEEFFKNLDRVFLKFKLERCYGKAIKAERLKGEERKLYKIESLNEAILRHIPREMLPILFSKRIDIRHSLLVMNMLKYCIETFESISNTKYNELGGFIKDCTYLRNNWFEIGPSSHRLLFSNLKDAVYASLDFIEIFTDYLLTEALICRKKGNCDAIRFSGRRFFTLFLDKWGKKEGLIKMVSVFNRIGRVITILPLPLSYQLTDYSDGQGILSEHIADNLTPKIGRWTFSNKQISQKRLKILDSYLDFLLHRNLHSRYNLFGYYRWEGIHQQIKYSLKRMLGNMIMRGIYTKNE